MKSSDMGRAPESKGSKTTSGKPEAVRAYATPRLVVLGEAFHLVQADDFHKMTQEKNGYFYDKH